MPRLSERVKFLKEDEHEKENIALKFLELGKLTLEEIAKCSGLTLKRVQMLAKTL